MAGVPPGERGANAWIQPAPAGIATEARRPERRGGAVWDRLPHPVILDSETERMADGGLRRRFLLQVDGKYPRLVLEGTQPAGQPDGNPGSLQGVTAWVADHLIVRRHDGLLEPAFRMAVEQAGLRLGERLAPGGPWRVELPEATIDGVEKAMSKLRSGGAAAYAEPDFLVHASDLYAAGMRVDLVDGMAIEADGARRLGEDELAVVPAPDAMPRFPQEQAASGYPTERVLTFDPPGFGDGQGFFSPYLIEQGFVVASPEGLVVRGASSASFPNNGTLYLQPRGDGLSIRHGEHAPFALRSADLAEYSVHTPSWGAVVFTGYKEDGRSVRQAFVLDGVIDGTGPVPDFETVHFGPEFTGLTEVVMWSPGKVMADNLSLVVEGPEAELPSPPEPPLFRVVTWDPPKHQLGGVTEVGGPHAPTSVLFGTPTVRAEVGSLPGPALEFAGSGYQQVRFAMQRFARAYRLEFDGYVDLPTPWIVYFDRPGGYLKLEFGSDGKLVLSQSSLPPTRVVGNYPPRTKFGVTVDLDMVAGVWEVGVDDRVPYRGRFNVSLGDLTDIRFHSGGGPVGRAGLDNVRIHAFGAGELAVDAPEIAVAPASVLFPDVPVGATATRFLSIQNRGSRPLELQSVSSPVPEFRVLGSDPVVLLPAGSFSVAVEFAPQQPGDSSGVLLIASNDPLRPLVGVPVRGSGVGVPDVTLEPATGLDVTMLAGTAASPELVVGNRGTADLEWSLSVNREASPYTKASVPAVTPDDPLFHYLWALKVPEAGGGGIDAQHAWSLTTGGESVVVAVIDSGIDFSHPELEGNIWANPGEIPDNGIDDDNNGYIDDVAGWDFYNRDARPEDDLGHGTHVAGTIASRGNNGIGVAGVGWRVRILPLKFLSGSGLGFTSDAILALGYARRAGARLSNNSWGGAGYSQALLEAIRGDGAGDSLFVAAAGNSAEDTDVHPHYPSGYDLDCVVSVAATDERGDLAEFSNFGRHSVDLAAPGKAILSLRPGGQFLIASGTSMAAAYVSGAAALLMDSSPGLSPDQMRQQLMGGADWLPGLDGQLASSGRLNAYGALTVSFPDWVHAGSTGGIQAVGTSAHVPLAVTTCDLEVGRHHVALVLRSNDPDQPSIEIPVSLEVVESNAYSRWLMGQFAPDGMLFGEAEATLWGDEADPDGDWMGNLQEWVMGGDPLGHDGSMAPAMVREGCWRFFEFQVRDEHEGVSCRVEWTPDLADGSWSEEGLMVQERRRGRRPDGIRHFRVRRYGAPSPSAFFRVVMERSEESSTIRSQGFWIEERARRR